MVGIAVYPLPLDTISIFVRDPFDTSGTPAADIPQGTVGPEIVMVGALIYPVPADPTLIFPTV